MPDDSADYLQQCFASASEKMVEAKRAAHARVDHDPTPGVAEALEEQLRQTFRDEHQERDLEQASVHRYVIEVEGYEGSVNQLAMSYSRLLTPPAALPTDRVMLEDELSHERPAHYPWTVEVHR